MTVNINSTDIGLMGDHLARAFMEQLERDVVKLRTEILPWTGAELIAEAVRLTKVVDAIFRGTMISAWRITPTNLGCIVGNEAPHAKAIEYGRLPGPIDRQAILEWTRVKLYGLPPKMDRSALPGAGNRTPMKGAVLLKVKRIGASASERAAIKKYRKQVTTKGGRADLENEAYQAAQNIADHIEKNGTEPRFILRDAMKVVPKRLRAFVRKNLPAVDVPF